MSETKRLTLDQILLKLAECKNENDLQNFTETIKSQNEFLKQDIDKKLAEIEKNTGINVAKFDEIMSDSEYTKVLKQPKNSELTLKIMSLLSQYLSPIEAADYCLALAGFLSEAEIVGEKLRQKRPQ